jgi:hypothetical protein
MKILSHRGYWKIPEEKNQPVAFERSFARGFGTETDVRDVGGRLAIAHDPPLELGFSFDDMLAIHGTHDSTLPLAINIKADGLQRLLGETLRGHGVTNYFLFDMSVPDAVQSIKAGLRIFTRHSDVEPDPVLYADAAGVWVDAFFDDRWITPAAIRAHLDAGKEVCLVSPELHKRPHLPLWSRLRDEGLQDWEGLMLCSDIPEEAVTFFEL